MERQPLPLLLPAGNPGVLTGRGSNTWLIDGREPTLVDAGVGSAEHLASLKQALGGRPLARVLVTHHHPDHAAGVPVLKIEWPAVEACKLLLPDEPAAGWRPLADGEEVLAGDGRLTVLHTPGHAADHVCFWDAQQRFLYSGDMVVREGTVMIPFGRGGSLAEYMASLDRMASLDPERLFPGHGDPIDNPLDVIGAYVEHRRQREREILACLGDGVVDVDAIVRRVYPDLAAELVEAATLTVRAHLEKLREEGKLRDER